MATNAAEIIGLLKKEYPGAKYYLKFSNPLQLLVATILSAQCKDDVVNSVTERLFKKYKTASDFTKLEEGDWSAPL